MIKIVDEHSLGVLGTSPIVLLGKHLLTHPRITAGRSQMTPIQTAPIVQIHPRQTPVEYTVKLISFTHMKIIEKLSDVDVVGFVLELQCASVLEKCAEFIWASTQKVRNRICLHLRDHLALLLGRGLRAIPGKRAAEEVDKNIGERFQIIAAGLLHA